MEHKTEIIHDLPSAEYRSRPGLNASLLKKFSVSPLHAVTDRFESSPATDLGSYIHAKCICPSELSEFAVMPTTGEGSRTARAKWKEEHPEGVLLSPSQKDIGDACAANIQAHHEWKQMHDGRDTRYEVSLFAEHPKFGIPMKARLDILAIEGTARCIIGDIKSFGGGAMTKKNLFWTIRDRGYDLQLAYYIRMAQLCNLPSIDQALLFFTETGTDARDVACVEVDPGWLALAENRMDELIAQYVECSFSGVFPGFNHGKKLVLGLGTNLG